MKKLLLVGGALIALGLLAACTAPTPKVVKETVVVEKEVVKEVEKPVEIVVTPTRPAEALESAQLATAEAQIEELRAQLSEAQATMTAIAAGPTQFPTPSLMTTPTSTSTPAPGVTELKIGDTATSSDGKWAVTLNDVTKPPKEAQEGYAFLRLDITLVNLNERDIHNACYHDYRDPFARFLDALMTNSKIMDQDGFTFLLQQGLGRVCIPVGYFATGSLETQVPITSKGLKLHMLGGTFSLEERSSSPVPIHVSPDPSHEYNTGDEIVMHDKVWKLSIDEAKHVKEETDTHRLEVKVTLTSLHGGGTLDPGITLPIYLVDEHGHRLYSGRDDLDDLNVPPRLSRSKTITMRWSGYDPESLKLIIALYNIYDTLIQAPNFTLVNYAVVDLGPISSISTPK